MPSWWLSTGLLEAAHGGPAGTLQAVGFLCVLLSNALLMPLLLGALGEVTLRRSFGQLSSGPRFSLPWQMTWLDRFCNRLLRSLSPTIRLVLIKDLRLFRRDPLQWSQFLLFFGLLSFYFIYVRRFDYGRQLTGWMTAIGFMNLGVVGLILSTFTTRFVFPLISIEGQRFWILGTAPVNRREILWSKFLFATINYQRALLSLGVPQRHRTATRIAHSDHDLGSSADLPLAGDRLVCNFRRAWAPECRTCTRRHRPRSPRASAAR